ncbi:MAG: carbamoyltransferase HypF [Nitrospirota bacterium]
MNSRLRISVKGIVQGVGFRPFVYSLAKSLNLKGFVLNSSEGVTIEVEGDNNSAFLERLKKEAPPLSQIMSVDVASLPHYGYPDFQIRESKDEGSFTLVSPDVSICDDCLRELMDNNDRRYLYPFINCTNCGPRYTITKSVPYDRPNTTMAVFKMCPDCDREYHDPENRRFHAQPNACPVCGPQVELVVKGESNPPSSPFMKVGKEEGFMKVGKEEGFMKGGLKRIKSSLRPFRAGLKEGSLKRGGHYSSPPLEKGGEGGFENIHSPIEGTIKLLKEGKIVAIKGLGGFHLACDATNKEAVERLRLKKRKSNKPFALMAPDIETIRKFCEISEQERIVLTSNKRPIVLLKKLKNSLPEAISPKNPYIGFMLPYTPLHYLLFYYPTPIGFPFGKVSNPGSPTLAGYTKTVIARSKATKQSKKEIATLPSAACNDTNELLNKVFTTNFDALVMTSGNISEEPIVVDNEEAVSRLSDIADAFLIHNRDIFMRTDDSVLKVMNIETKAVIEDPSNSNPPPPPFSKGGPGGITGSASFTRHLSLSFIRRSRGYVPDPIPLHEDGPDVLGTGADIKNIFTLTKGSFAIPSQHIGDMENYETLMFFEESLKNLKDVYRVKPVALAYDLHPMYLSTQWAMRQDGIKKIGIQHHYAHIASVMAEKGIKEKVIGISFDGTGYGTDGNLWGGEFLIADIKGFERVGHFRYVPLPGGEVAVREPWRMAVSFVKDAAGKNTLSYLKSLGFLKRYGDKKIKDVLKILEVGQFSPLASGAGRLFDAVSAIMGVCDKNTFEGEAAIALEAVTRPDVGEEYPVDIKIKDVMEIDFSCTILKIVEDLSDGVDRGIISSKFHNTVISVIIKIAKRLSSVYRINDVALCGGVFQNMYILEKALPGLQSEGLRAHIHEKVPANDAGISLGQAYIIRERIKAGIE